MFYEEGETTPYQNCPGRPWQCFPVKVEQVGDRWFQLLKGFDWKESASSPVIEVRGDKLDRTDLASIPFFLRWFASGYGRHTPAALLHDQLRRTPEAPTVSREESDRIFLVAMRELGVPLVRRLIMWTSVVAAGRALAARTPNENDVVRAFVRAILTWGWLILLGVMWLWVAGVINFDLPRQLADSIAPRTRESILVAALAAPVVLGLVWDREFAAGVLAGWAIPVFLPFGMAGVLITFLVYGVVELAFMALIMIPKLIWYALRWLASRLGVGSDPPPLQPIPGPTPWGGALLRRFRGEAARSNRGNEQV